MTKQQTEKKPCDCGCGKTGKMGKMGSEEKACSSKMTKKDEGNMVQALKDESSYAKKTLGK